MIFYLKGSVGYQISAVGTWCENSRGEMVGSADTYFRHIMTGQRCESVWVCLSGWSKSDEKTTEQWETLCQRIEEYGNLEETICTEESIGV
ncbi:MAG: hypothetical protein AUK59_04120 [Candidatus Altarchaeum sp. CG2_30_32_3053]|nr:MAG: hypothetical protein AUK59_04120 [Candidatus Altarchaeum sp. CG2_30_32_3053]